MLTVEQHAIYSQTALAAYVIGQWVDSDGFRYTYLSHFLRSMEPSDDRIFGDGAAIDGLANCAAPGEHGADFMDGVGGNDILVGQGNGDALYGGEGNVGKKRDSAIAWRMNPAAEIKTGQRRVTEFLLSPIQRAGMRF